MSTRPHRHRRKRGNILVVDDHPHSAEIVGRLLQRQGYRATLIFCAKEALRRLASEQFDAVISDVEMDGMSGFELLTQIRLRHVFLPVILMTAFFDEEKRVVAQFSGAVALLRKPFSDAELDAILRASMPAIGHSSPTRGRIEKRERI